LLDADPTARCEDGGLDQVHVVVEGVGDIDDAVGDLVQPATSRHGAW
jgi:hypothetical protein